ncbi:MAG: RIP metalloprotease RseP [Paludibacteraceae bacterium]|nr:RIP metalloprotease RseP [Paludibacteraceae bacterium]
MSSFWIRALQLLLSLSFLVVIHELGHFAWARIFKVRVEKFYVFFNPRFSLVRWKRINGKLQFRFFARNTDEALKEAKDEYGNPKVDKKGLPILVPFTDKDIAELPDDDWRKYPDNTEWGIGWLPFGGYCRIAGMVDETTSANELAAEPQTWEYRSQSTWKRMLIISGGVIVNFIGALLIYSMILFHWGDDVLPVDTAPYGMCFSESMHELGFVDGDRILSVGGKSVAGEDLGNIIYDFILDGEQQVVVERNGVQQTITIPADYSKTFMERKEGSPVTYAMPFVIDSVLEGGAAYKGGLVKGDRVIAVAAEQTPWFTNVQKVLKTHACDSVEIQYVRNADTLTTNVFISDLGQLGVSVKPLEWQHVDYGFFASFPAGIKLGVNTLVNYVRQFKLVFTKEGAESLGGFGAIGSLFTPVWNWHAFWLMTAFLSIILAFMNFLPIPGLDGGYFIFLIYEMITGRKPSDKFMEWTTNIGFILLLLLVLYANGNDIFKAFK